VVVDRSAQGVTPSWRADSLAVAYVGSGGRPIVYDLSHESHKAIRWAAARPTVHLAFAPGGTQLALSTENAALVVGEHHHHVLWRGQTRGVAWVGNQLVVSERIVGRTYTVGRVYSVQRATLALARTVRLPAPILATHGRTVAVVSHKTLLAGSLDSLRPVLQFRLKPCQPGPFAAYICEIPIGSGGVDLG
jgi:hypothetical protein